MHWPTPPQPNTTARSPGRTAAVLKTAPTPVIAAQPISAATSRSAPSGSSTACVAGTTTCSAKHAVAMKCPRSCPRARRRELPSGMRWRCEPISHSAGEPDGARATATAGRHPRERDGIADARRQHAGADGVDDPRALVAEHHRQVVRPHAVHDVEIGAADARGGDAHAHLARLRLAQLDLLDAQRSAATPTARRLSSACAQHRQRVAEMALPDVGWRDEPEAGRGTRRADRHRRRVRLRAEQAGRRVEHRHQARHRAARRASRPFAAAAIKGTTLDGEAVLAREPRGQAGLHQLLGLVVPALQEGGARPAQLLRTGSAVRRRSSAWRSTPRRPTPVASSRKARLALPDRQPALLRPRQPLRRDLLPDDDRRQRPGAGRRPPGRPADARLACKPSCARSAPRPCRLLAEIALSPVGLSAAFAAGVISFVSPCVWPLVPAYLSYVSGVSFNDLGDQTRRVTIATAAFVLGFGAVFTALGRRRGRHRRPADRAPANARDRLRPGDRRSWAPCSRASAGCCCSRNGGCSPARAPAGPVGAVVAGAGFGIGWTPCVGPTLAAILALAGRSGPRARRRHPAGRLLARPGRAVPALGPALHARPLEPRAAAAAHAAARARLGRRADRRSARCSRSAR